MAEICWTSYQRSHIEVGHGITESEFAEAWHDPGREDLAEGMHGENGPYTKSLGSTELGRLIEMVWRWQYGQEFEVVWPITAYEVE